MYTCVDKFIRKTLTEYYEMLGNPTSIPIIVEKRLAAMERLGNNEWFDTIAKRTSVCADTSKQMYKLCYRASRLHALLTGNVKDVVHRTQPDFGETNYDQLFQSLVKKFKDDSETIKLVLASLNLVDDLYSSLITSIGLYAICNNPFRFHCVVGKLLNHYVNVISNEYKLDRPCTSATVLNKKSVAMSAVKSLSSDVALVAVHGVYSQKCYFSSILTLLDINREQHGKGVNDIGVYNAGVSRDHLAAFRDYQEDNQH